MAKHKQLLPGNEIICHTCVYGPGGHGKKPGKLCNHCEAKEPIMSRGMTNIVVCNHYTDILTAETKSEKPITGGIDD